MRRRDNHMTQGQGSTPLQLKGYVVAFLDIAGQRIKLGRLRKAKWWTGDDETRKIVRETYGSVTRFRDHHRLFLQASSGLSPVGREFLASNPTKEQREIWEATQKCGQQVSYQYLGDCIITFVPLQVIDGIFPFVSVVDVMGQCCHSILASFCERRAIRGGLAIGPCVHNRETGEVYGSALSEAVKLEEEAKWFRLLVDEELIHLADTVAASEPITPAQRVNVTFAKKCLSLVKRDADGRWILDYLGKGIRKVYDIPQHLETAACGFIQCQIAEMKGTPEIQHKYQMAADYFAENGVLPAKT